jgi:hypothetical protein
MGAGGTITFVAIILVSHYLFSIFYVVVLKLIHQFCIAHFYCAYLITNSSYK